MLRTTYGERMRRMANPGALARLCGVVLTLACCLAAGGCSLGYMALHPGENSALYTPLFADIITTYDEPHWLWIRGVMKGDFDGDGKVEEEAVIATIQSGSEREPGPIEAAFLAVCHVSASGERTAVARKLLFRDNPIPAAPTPILDLGMGEVRPFTRVRGQVIQDKLLLAEAMVVYFYSDPLPSGVWYSGYRLTEDHRLEQILETAMWQATPGILTANLDKRMESRHLGYQLLFGVDAIPDAIASELGSSKEVPIWGHIYTRNADGIYEQGDWRFGEHYRQVENSWNQGYLKAVIHGMPPEDLAWFEYHMGIMNHFTGNEEMSHKFLDKAARYAKDERLARAITEARELLDELPSVR